MTLLDAKEPDLARERRRKITISTIVVAILIIAWLGWTFRFWPQERVADEFFAALQKQDYEAAYGIYFADPAWKQHPQLHAQYAINEFRQDWGPGSEWGLIKSYKIEASGYCPGGTAGVVVQVIVNDRAERARIWVQKSDKTITFPPC